MKRIIRLTESDLTRIVRRVISEQEQTDNFIGGVDFSSNPNKQFREVKGFYYTYTSTNNSVWGKNQDGDTLNIDCASGGARKTLKIKLTGQVAKDGEFQISSPNWNQYCKQ